MSKQKNQSYHHGDLRSALIQASVELVSKHGADNFSLKDASIQAGVSVAAPYRHFTDKVELLQAVAVEGFSIMRADMLQVSKGLEVGSVECITALGVQYVEFARTYPQLFRLMFSENTNGPKVVLDDTSDEEDGFSLSDLVKALDMEKDGQTDWADQLPTESARCFAILLVNISNFLRKHEIPITQTLELATPLWATVHGTAGLLLDHSFQNLSPAIDPERLIKDSTEYFCSGFLAKRGKLKPISS